MTGPIATSCIPDAHLNATYCSWGFQSTTQFNICFWHIHDFSFINVTFACHVFIYFNNKKYWPQNQYLAVMNTAKIFTLDLIHYNAFQFQQMKSVYNYVVQHKHNMNFYSMSCMLNNHEHVQKLKKMEP